MAWQEMREINGVSVRMDTRFCEGIAYSKIWHNVPAPCCWGCGNYGVVPPIWWNAPFLLERAHIVNKPRKKDRRAIVLLCSECHKQSHGINFPEGNALPELSVSNMIWLKEKYDPWFFDREFLESCCLGKLPEAEPIGKERIESIKKYQMEWDGLTESDFAREIEDILRY